MSPFSSLEQTNIGETVRATVVVSANRNEIDPCQYGKKRLSEFFEVSPVDPVQCKFG